MLPAFSRKTREDNQICSCLHGNSLLVAWKDFDLGVELPHLNDVLTVCLLGGVDVLQLCSVTGGWKLEARRAAPGGAAGPAPASARSAGAQAVSGAVVDEVGSGASLPQNHSVSAGGSSGMPGTDLPQAVAALPGSAGGPSSFASEWQRASRLSPKVGPQRPARSPPPPAAAPSPADLPPHCLGLADRGLAARGLAGARRKRTPPWVGDLPL